MAPSPARDGSIRVKPETMDRFNRFVFALSFRDGAVFSRAIPSTETEGKSSLSLDTWEI
jgi:hypothetical protein